jgi:hypothetical protein
LRDLGEEMFLLIAYSSPQAQEFLAMSITSLLVILNPSSKREHCKLIQTH